jgi:segregation and condensation protein A
MTAPDSPPDLGGAAALAAEDGEGLIVDVEGYEGPLHLLLDLAKRQKVDLLKLSILKLADQYLAFVHQARRANFALAADYLVMASWLAYLKSRLLLPAPRPKGLDEPEPEEVAAALAFTLAKLDAMRRAADALQRRAIVGRDVFLRGDPDAVKVTPSLRLEGDLYALMDAFAAQVRRKAKRGYKPRAPVAFPLEDARERLRSMLPDLGAWTSLQGVAPRPRTVAGTEPSRASYVASTLSATLELVKEGAMEARQLDVFADLYVRARRVERD